MSPRLLSASLVAVVAVLAGCSADSSSSSDDPSAAYAADPTAYTVSYRNKVRLPTDGSHLTADRYATQLGSGQDPTASIRCGAENAEEYKGITEFLGGIAWSTPMSIIKDASFPVLYAQKQNFGESFASPGASDAAGPSPTIERPDLVGVKNGVAVFLSKRHGLLAVDARTPALSSSCAMKLPGEPKNFFFKNDELVVIVNALNGHNRAALLRFKVGDGKFSFIDDVRLPNQNVLDARLFDSTIVAYTDWSKERAPTPIPEPEIGSGGLVASFGPSANSYGAGGDFAAPGYGYGYNSADHQGTKVIVVNWDDKLDIDWQDSLLDDPQDQGDPLQGKAPDANWKPGDVVARHKTWKTFGTASDRYFVVPRDVTTTMFKGYQTYTYQVCTSWNPMHHQVEQCSVQYEKRANPDYVPPNPQTGDYSCNGQKLEDCIVQAAPVVSQYIYAPVGQTCQQVWVGQCERTESRSTTYPEFENGYETELTVYRFENGSFTKLDATLAKMTQKTDALAFETSPLVLSGSISNRNQIQFQNGHLYVLSDNALQTMAVAGGSISYLNRLDVSVVAPAVAFSSDRVMVSSYAGSYPHTTSTVAMIDLTSPSIPKKLNEFTMPGTSSQLFLATGGILGPGNVSFTNQQVNRTLEKLTLFSNTDGSELDNLLLGTEYDAFETSWFSQEDDQRIRLGDSGTRLFLPYSGRHHADPYEPIAHRLNISRIDGGRLVSERSFAISEDIIRTAAIDDNRSLVFGDSSTHVIDHTTGDWTLTTLREIFVPFATYRLSDTGLHARLDRVGSKCRVLTFASDAGIFGATPLASADVPCGESSIPFGFGSSLLFGDTHTGVTISKDGTKIDVLSADDVTALLAKIPQKVYCWASGVPQTSGLIDYLDVVPASISCEVVPQN